MLIKIYSFHPEFPDGNYIETEIDLRRRGQSHQKILLKEIGDEALLPLALPSAGSVGGNDILLKAIRHSPASLIISRFSVSLP